MPPETGKVVSLFKAMSSLVARASLANRLGKTFGGDRDIYLSLGYKKTLEFDDYNERYRRGGIAGRIVDAPAAITWRNEPSLVEIGSTGEITKFEQAWVDLATRLQLYHFLERADKVSGIGRYGVLLIGVRGGRALEEPLVGELTPEDIIFLAPYSEDNATIRQFETDASNPRFGLPLMYDLKLSTGLEGFTASNNMVKVHHSRLIHIAEALVEDDIFGIPRLHRVWNYLDDLDKIMGGSAEGVWQTVNRGIQFDVDKDMELEGDDIIAFEDEIEDYMHGHKRYMRTKGITANVLGSEIPDPRGPFQVVSSLISGVTGMPQRILFGSERGQLASSLDERNWNSRIKERQGKFAETKMIRPMVDKFIQLGVLPEVKYNIKWPDLNTMSMREVADVAARMGQAIRNISVAMATEGEPLISAAEVRRLWLGLPDEIDGGETSNVISKA